MIRITTMAGRRVAVFGLGASGTATAQALLQGGAEVAAWDDGEASRAAAAGRGVPLVDLSTADWSGFAALVLAPGVPLTHPQPHWTVLKARAAGVEVIGDIELFFRERAALCPRSPVIAITGTNGKSTTTALITHILRWARRDVQMGGNIGRAILDLEPPAIDRFHVIEMSSFQIDLTPSLKPSIGVLLNLSADHLDRHGPADDADLAMRNYAAIKARLVAASETAIVGADDVMSRAIASSRADSIRASTKSLETIANELPAKGVLAVGSKLYQVRNAVVAGQIADLSGIGTLRGEHNAQNACVAAAIAVELGIASDQLQAALATYPGLPHRMEEVGRVGKVVFINDSKATNADSTEKALASWDHNIFWILGGKPKEGGIASLAPYFSRVAKAYLIGAASDEFARSLEGNVAYERCGTLDVALVSAARDAAVTAGSECVVLLSPACASYDQFKSFEHRGDVFRSLVQQKHSVSDPGKPSEPRLAP